jgi:hypothetical protein
MSILTQTFHLKTEIEILIWPIWRLNGKCPMIPIDSTMYKNEQYALPYLFHRF